MKILIINSLYYPILHGGAEKSTQVIAEGLVKRGHEIVVLSLTKESESKVFINGVVSKLVKIKNIYWPFEAKNRGFLSKIVWHTLNLRNPFANKDVSRILDEFVPDIVHLNNLTGFSTLILDAIQARGIPIVQTLRDYYYLCNKSSMFRNGNSCEHQCLGCLVTSKIKQLPLSETIKIVGNSREIIHTHQRYSSSFAELPSRVIYNGLDDGYYQRSQKFVHQYKSTSFNRFGYIGRIDPAKGIEFALDQFVKHYLSSGFSFFVAGADDSSYSEYLKEKYAEYADINFLGYIDTNKFFEEFCDLLIIPSIWREPLPRVAFEALAYGIPVLSSDAGGTSEIIDENVGRVYNSTLEGDFVAKLDCLVKILKEDWPGIVKACVSTSQRFKNARVIDEYESLFKSHARIIS